MPKTVETETTGRGSATTESSASLRTLVYRIQRRRLELGQGHWLSEELRMALEEMGPILQKAKVTLEVARGLKSTVLIKPIRSGRLDPSDSVEAYSIKMMIKCLMNPSNQFLSHALEPDCRQARQQLIANLRETYHLLVGRTPLDGMYIQHTRSDAPRLEVSAPANETKTVPFLGTLRERNQVERKRKLLDTVLSMRTSILFRRENEQGFHQICDTVWEEVQSGSLPESTAAGKILAQIYSSRAAKAVPSVCAKALPPPVPPKDDVRRTCRERPLPDTPAAQAATLQLSPTGKQVELPAILANWVGQGLAANRIFRDLRKTSGLEKRVTRWTKTMTEPSIDVEYLLVLRIFGSVGRFIADDEIVSVRVPLIPEMGFAEFEALIAQGKAIGVYDIDPRIWGVIGGVYFLTKRWLGPQLVAAVIDTGEPNGTPPMLQPEPRCLLACE